MRLCTTQTLAVLLGASAFGFTAILAAQSATPQYGYGQGQAPGYAQNQGQGQNQAGWDVPPPNFSQVQANGFRDGIVAAQDDIAHRIQPNSSARPEYRNPPQMPFMQRMMYRDGFQKGYQRAMDRFYGMPAPPPPQPVVVAPPPQQTMGYGDMLEFRHRGFQEGIDGALRDLDNNRRPDPNNRDEFRHPNVPYGMADPYRDGFRRGYDEGIRALTAMPNEWRQGPMSDIHMRGYREGAAGAVRDWNNNRRPDPNNRDEYRRPNVPPGAQEPYREGFRRGYQRIADALNGYIGRR
jgi:hypothetical protein